MNTRQEFQKESDGLHPSVSHDMNAFVEANMGLVHTVANRSLPRVLKMGLSMDRDDLVQELVVVMIRCYGTFDQAQGAFSTYFFRAAYNYINHTVDRRVMEQTAMPTISIEAAKFSDSDETYSLEETVAAEVPAITAMMEAEDLIARARRKLSKTAQAALDVALNPPDEVEDELFAAQVHAAEARALGKMVRARQEVTTGFVLELMEKSGVITHGERRKASLELNSFARSIHD